MAYRIYYTPPPSSASWHMNWVDGDRKKVSIIDRTPDGGTGIGKSLVSNFLCGRPIKPGHLPTAMRPTLGIKKFPDFFNAAGGSYAVTKKFKTVVEALEPDVHQFFPFDIVNKKGEVRDRMFIFIVCNRIDAVHPEKSNRVFEGKRWKRRDELYDDPNRKDWEGKDRLVLDDQKIAGYHIWYDKHLSNQENPFYSNEMTAALKAADLHHVVFGPIDED